MKASLAKKRPFFAKEGILGAPAGGIAKASLAKKRPEGLFLPQERLFTHFVGRGGSFFAESLRAAAAAAAAKRWPILTTSISPCAVNGTWNPQNQS